MKNRTIIKKGKESSLLFFAAKELSENILYHK
jgi:hypothetical protein